MKGVTIAVLLVASTAAADPRDHLDELQGGAWLHYELTELHVVDRNHAEVPVHDLLTIGAKLHGMVGLGAHVGYHVGFEFAVGGTLDRAGFAYDVTLFPVGIGVRLARRSFVALGAGIEATGATPTLDDAVAMPLEATLELGLHRRLRLLARARVTYIAGAPGRHDGAPSIAFADELDAMVGLRVGHNYSDYDYPTGNGYFVAAAYRELLGAQFAGLVIGYSIDIATHH